jgi:hypothetical protein
MKIKDIILNEFAPSLGFGGDDGPQLQLDQIGGESGLDGKFSYVYTFDIFSSDGELIGWCQARMSTGKLSGDINDEDFAVSLRDISNPLVTQALSEIYKYQSENPDELDEAEFNPGRRGFLKKAGAAATAAAMPRGLAGAAMKAAAPAAASATSILSAPFAGLTAIDLDDIINLLDSTEEKNMIPGEDPYELDTIIQVAQDAGRNSWGNSWFVNGNAAKALLNAIELAKKNNMSNNEIIDGLKASIDNLFQAEMELLKPEDKRKLQSQSLRSFPVAEPTASTPSGISSLARAAGAQMGKTMKNVGKDVAGTVLNQPAKDMGKIEPSAQPEALPEPTKPEFEIPSTVKQKSKVEVDRELDEAKFNPSRRGFLKTAGAVAASAAMPKSLAGAAMKAVTPAVSDLTSPFAGLTALDLNDIRHVLKQYHGLHAGSDYEAFTIDEIKDLAQDAIRWGNVWFYNKNSAQALLNAVELGKKNGMMEDEILDELKATVGELYKTEMKKLPPKDAAKVRSQSLDNQNGSYRSDQITRAHELEKVSRDLSTQPKASGTPLGTTGLTRAIGNTVQKIGRGTANTILNQPAKDMGKIEPSAQPAALPAPTKPEFEIPSAVKQKSKVEVDRELDRLKELVRK